ncbi:MAG: pilus assembly FimT family protein [Vibrio sp.]
MRIFRELPRGMTLIELVIVLAIIGGTLSLCVPSLQQSQQSLSASALADELVLFVSSAQQLANQRHQDLVIRKRVTRTLEATAWQLTVVVQSPPVAAAPLLVLEGELFNGMDVSMHYTKQQLWLDGFRHKLSNGHIRITDRQGRQRLRVVTSYATGRIRVCAQEDSRVYPAC